MWRGAGLTGMRLIAIYSPLVLDTYSVDFRNVPAASRAIRTRVRNAQREPPTGAQHQPPVGVITGPRALAALRNTAAFRGWPVRQAPRVQLLNEPFACRNRPRPGCKRCHGAGLRAPAPAGLTPLFWFCARGTAQRGAPEVEHLLGSRRRGGLCRLGPFPFDGCSNLSARCASCLVRTAQPHAHERILLDPRVLHRFATLKVTAGEPGQPVSQPPDGAVKAPKVPGRAFQDC